jgi:peptidyl-prolyl cis-trans isomerase C
MRLLKSGYLTLSGVMAVLFIGVFLFTGCEKAKVAAPASGKDVVATVGNEVITLKDVDERIAKLPAYYQNVIKGRKKELVEDMVLEKLFYDEARKKGVQNDKEVKEMVEEAQKRIVISKFIRDAVENQAAVSDKEAQDYYNIHKDEFSLPERWRASHILVKTEGEAKAILDELAGGKSFEDLAKEKSQDASAQKGGDLGYFTTGQMVPEFEKAVAKMEVGQPGEIVQTQFGYHIIKVTDKKDAQAQEFKDVAAKVKNDLLLNKKRNLFDKMVEDLKAKSNVKIKEELLEEKRQPPMQPSASQAMMPEAQQQTPDAPAELQPDVQEGGPE